MDGSHFSGHIDYIKTTIVNAFATSESMQYGANKRISKAVGDKIGKNVSIVTREVNRNHNGHYVHRNSHVKLEVKGLEILLFTLY